MSWISSMQLKKDLQVATKIAKKGLAELRPAQIESLPLIVLRDLPAIAEIERLTRGQGEWLTDAEIAERADKVSLQLFGISDKDTYGPGLAVDGRTDEQWLAAEARHPAWEVGFLAIYDDRLDDDEYLTYWREHGVDGADAEGGLLRCFDLFSRQLMLVFVQTSMWPGLSFTPDGSGGVKANAEAWGAALEAEARLFKRK